MDRTGKMIIKLIKSALREVKQTGLAQSFWDPCLLCQETPTLVFSTPSRDGKSLMQFYICHSCAEENALVEVHHDRD